jgi:hypothetical protein
MAEFTDVACDICGKLYHWTVDRLGDTAICRECGTKFDVTEYVAPPEDDEESIESNPLPWIKGASVVALILLVLVGLSSLLFIRPNSYAGSYSNRPSNNPAVPNWSAPVNPARKPWGRAGHQPAPQMPPVIMPLPGQPAGKSGVVPVISGWQVNGPPHDLKIRLTGQGLQGVTSAEELLGPTLHSVNFQILSDTVVELNRVQLGAPNSTLFVVQNSVGMAVAFCRDVRTITGRETDLGNVGSTPIHYVRTGGHLETNSSSVVLLDNGARLTTKSPAHIAFLKQGSELNTSIVFNYFSEPGARIIGHQANNSPTTNVREIKFCPLPALSVGGR